MDGPVDAFSFFGAVPVSVVYDNVHGTRRCCVERRKGFELKKR